MRIVLEGKDAFNPKTDKVVQAIVLNGVPVPWSLSEKSLEKAKQIWEKDPTMRKPIIVDMCQHLLKVISTQVGRTVTIKELNEALDNGYIEA